MKNINLASFNNMVIYFTITVLIFIGCGNLKVDNKKGSTSLVESVTLKKQVNIYPIELKLDTNSQFQNKIIEPEDSLFFGNEKYLIHVNEGNDIGYILFKSHNDFYVSLIEWSNNFKVIGISEITGLNEGEEYIELLYSDSPITSIIFGKIKNENSKIKTVKAWQINNIKKKIEEINPASLDFSETYNTEI